LQGFEGILQVDGYAGYNRVPDLRDNAPIQLANCWVHARRKLFDLRHNNVASIADEGLKQIAALYRIEAQARGTSVDERLALRHAKSAPATRSPPNRPQATRSNTSPNTSPNIGTG
jgi:transposase